MSNPVSAVELVKKAAVEAVEAAKPVNILFGRVICVSPLKIQVDQKAIYTQRMLVLAQTVTDYEMDMTACYQSDASAHTHAVSGSAAPVDHSHTVTGLAEQAAHTHPVTGRTEDEMPVEGVAAQTDHGHAVTGQAQSASHGHPVSGTAQEASHSHTISGRKRYAVHNALAVGDWVVMVRMQKGKKYLVLDRIAPHPALQGEWL